MIEGAVVSVVIYELVIVKVQVELLKWLTKLVRRWQKQRGVARSMVLGILNHSAGIINSSFPNRFKFAVAKLMFCIVLKGLEFVSDV